VNVFAGHPDVDLLPDISKNLQDSEEILAESSCKKRGVRH